MATNPVIFPEFATEDQNTGALGGLNVVEPSASQKESGWVYDEYPPAEIFNWLHRYTYRWLQYQNSLNSECDNFFRSTW